MSKTKSKSKNRKEITNFYELDDMKRFMKTTINPNYNYHKISIEMRGLLIGSSGAGKSQTVLQLLSDMPNTFNKMYIYTRAEEPLYNYLQSKIHSDLLTISYDLNDFRKFNEKDYYGQTLIIFDDLILEKDQKCIEEMYIRGRKIGVSCLYLSQSFFKIPKTIRLQSEYIFIIKVGNLRDLNLILSEFSLGTTKQQLQNMYKYICTKGNFGDFFLIDLKTSQSSGLQYRKNFITNLNPSDFN